MTATFSNSDAAIESRISAIEKRLGIHNEVFNDAETHIAEKEQMAAADSNVDIAVSTTIPTNQSKDIESRMSCLSRQIETMLQRQKKQEQKQKSQKNTTSPATAAVDTITTTIITGEKINREIADCEKLEKELNPGSLLSYQTVNISSTSSSSSTSFVAPLLYRRQQILSSKESLEKTFRQLSIIRDLLHFRTPSSPKNNTLSDKVNNNGEKDDKNVESTNINKYISYYCDGGGTSKDSILSSTTNSETFHFSMDKENQDRLERNVLSKLESLEERSIKITTRLDNLLALYERSIDVMNEKMIIALEEVRVKDNL